MAGTPDTGVPYAAAPGAGLEFLAGAFKVRRRVFLTSASLMLLTIILALVIAPKYAATSSLLLLLGSEYTARVEAGQSPSTTAALGRDEMVNSEMEILGGAALHEAVIRSIGLERLYPDALDPPGLLAQALDAAAAWARATAAQFGIMMDAPKPVDPVRLTLRRFDRALEILALKDGNVIEVTFRHKDAAMAADTVNELIFLYLQRRQAIYRDVQSGIVAGRLQAALVAVDAADRALAQFKQRVGIADFDAERDLLLRRRDAAARAVAGAEADLLQQEQRLDAMTHQLADLPRSIEFYHDTDSAGRITNVKATLEALRAKQAETLTHYQPESRPALDLEREITAQQAGLQALLTDRSASSNRSGRNPAYDSIDLDRAHAETERAAAQATRDAAVAEVAVLDQSLRTLAEAEPALLALTRRRGALEDNYRSLAHLADERQMIEAAEDRAAASVRVIEPAAPPVQPGHLTLLILIGGALLSAVAGAAVVVLSEAARRTFLSAARLERQLQLPVLASVPDFLIGAPPRLGPRRTARD